MSAYDVKGHTGYPRTRTSEHDTVRGISPGKRTLVEAEFARIGNLQSSGASTGHPASSARVAEREHTVLNAVIKVVAYDDHGSIVRAWGARARWEGPLPKHLHGRHVGARWDWDDATSARTVRMHTHADGTGGETVEAWAGQLHAARVEIFAEPSEAVAKSEDSLDDAREPGAGQEAHNAHSDAASVRAHHAPGDHGTHEIKDQHGPSVPVGSTGPSADGSGAAERKLRGEDSELDPSGEPDERLADAIAFERELGIEVQDDEHELHGAAPGAGGAGYVGGEVAGRTGADASTSGQGPGGPNARAYGDGEGSTSRTDNQGTKSGTWAGDPNGSPDGMFGGEGVEGDKGIPSGGGLFGGVIPVPDCLKGAVELGLIIEQGDIAGAGGNLFRIGLRKGVQKGLTIAAVRRLLAREARIAADRETRALLRQLTRRKAFASLSDLERTQVRRILYWEKQRQFFRGYLDAAKAERRAAREALAKANSAKRAAIEGREAVAAAGEEVARVEPVAGRLPANHAYAGQEFPRAALPKKYQERGLRFKDTGYPDFEPYAKVLPNGKKEVRIALTGSRRGDFSAAVKAAGLDDMPRGWTWHHDEGDLGVMRLVPDDLHRAVNHTGGVAEYKHRHGVDYGN
jgi:hypothetical protein